MTELDGADRLDPSLRAIATTRTTFSAEAIRLIRAPFDRRRREAFEELEAPGVQIAEDNVVFENGPESGLVPVRIYRCGEVRRAPVVVYCHAGGFALGNLDTDHRQCVELARRAGCVVVSVDYRLAPEHPYPAALDDATAVLNWVVSNAAEWLTLQSSLWTKCLPHARMREVLVELKKWKVPTVLLGTTNDPGDYPVDIDLRGRSNLLEAAEIVRKSRLVLGPEGGLVNLARAVSVPSVVFFGSTPVEFFGFKANRNLAPSFCGGCWWTTESYLRQCPLLEPIPPCTNSIDAPTIVAAVEELFHR